MVNYLQRVVSGLRKLFYSRTLVRAGHRDYRQPTPGEFKVVNLLKDKFPDAKLVEVQDISGGCGAMYEVHIESEQFKGKSFVQQHQMVNEALKEEIKDMHGLRILTSVPE